MPSVRAQEATRQATDRSQGPSEPRTQSPAALRARTRNVAWNASSAACGSLEDRTARPEDHRPMPLHQDGEGQLGSRPVAVREPLQELPVGLLSDRAGVEERLDVPEKGSLTTHSPVSPGPDYPLCC